MMSLYQPGVCNLGKNEVNKRWIAAVVGFGLTIILTVLLVYFNFFMPFSLVLNFIPLMIGFAGVYQAQNKFCVAFAARGIYNFQGTAEEKGKVINLDDHKLDLAKAKKINIKSVFSSLILTLVILIPLSFVY